MGEWLTSCTTDEGPKPSKLISTTVAGTRPKVHLHQRVVQSNRSETSTVEKVKAGETPPTPTPPPETRSDCLCLGDRTPPSYPFSNESVAE